MWREQAIIEWSWHVNSIVACCHSAKLCAYAARDFRSQHYQHTEWILHNVVKCVTFSHLDLSWQSKPHTLLLEQRWVINSLQASVACCSIFSDPKKKSRKSAIMKIPPTCRSKCYCWSWIQPQLASISIRRQGPLLNVALLKVVPKPIELPIPVLQYPSDKQCH